MLGIVTVNYGQPDLVARYAASRELPAGEMQFFLVDNYTSEENAAAVQTLAQQHGWTPVLERRNGGFSCGCNAGAAAAIDAGATSLAFVNPDVDVSAEVLAVLQQQVEENPLSIVGPALVEPSRQHPFIGGATSLRDGNSTTPGAAESFPWLSGASLVMSVSAFQHLGGFDEDYFMYWEDVDFCYRAAQAGYTLRSFPDVKATHDVGATQGTTHKSPLYVRYNCRNRLVFAQKNLGAEQRSWWRRSTASYAYGVILRSGSKKYLAHGPSLVAAVQGSYDGLTWRQGTGQNRA